ncbi:MAG TPA: glycosyltransferase family 39 protein [Pilimelia sp.]|nr:glycosyltransferase family 39 protein [Pilimelia sp.]
MIEDSRRGAAVDDAGSARPAAPDAAAAPPERPPVAWLPVGLVAAAIAALLAGYASRYDYHRDELYFRLLADHPAWGYVDQPPLTPMLAKLAIAIFGDTAWAIRVPALVAVATTTVLTALVARELGGGRAAQVLAAAGVASAFPLLVGHLLLTATTDLVVWLLVILFVMRALLRDQPRYWLAAGAVAGVGLYNRHLVILLLLGLAAGLLLVGPRRVLATRWPWAGAALAVVIGAPNLIYQIANGFPQLDMAAALAENKGDEARPLFVPMQLVMLGVLLVPIWIAGLVTLLRDRRLRPVRAVAVAYPVVCVLLLAIAGQFYYTMGLVLALYAAGSVATVRWLAGRPWRWALVGAAVALNVVLSALISLPVLPVDVLARTPIPEINQATRDQIGWPEYVRQVAAVYQSLPPHEQVGAVIITGNYGEAGALVRYGGPYDLPAVYSGQNQLWHLGPPPPNTEVVITVGAGGEAFHQASFERCFIASRLENGVDIDNEEQGVPVRICHRPRESWDRLWPRFQHFD